MQPTIETTAPIGATGDPSLHLGVIGGWPAPSEWPAPDAHPMDVARFWRDRMGAMVLPTPSTEDTRDYAAWLHKEAVRDHRDSNGGADPSAEVDQLLRDDSRDLAADARKAPIPRFAKTWAGKTSATLTDADLARAWGDKQRGAHRGACIVLGDLAQVDVDPRHGGSVAGEWATMDGPRVSTPGGGVHVFTLGAGVKPSTGKHALAPGVEIRTSGYAVIPSGSSSPNRQWLCVDPPRAAPPAMCRGGTPPARKRRDPNATPQPWDEPAADDCAPGRVAYILANDAGEGERNDGARVIVGMLARPAGLPDDAVRAALDLLGEWGAGQDWQGARAKEEAARWHGALTRGPRDAEFAAEVVATWIAVRDVNPRRWSPAKARTTARSIWKTCDRREEGNAGAEDMGHAGGVADYTPPPPRQAAHAETTPAPAPAVNVAAAYVPLPPIGTEEASEAAKEERFLRAILPTIGEAYPLESMARDMAKKPIRVDALYPFMDFWSVELEPPDDYGVSVGHGYGQWFSRALGGLCEGDFKALGAAGAKAGKTHFLGQMIEGLALNTAARVLGIPGYSDAPIIMPVWVSEMPKEGEVLLRMVSRHLGFDMHAITDGQAAGESAGVMHMANEHQVVSSLVVSHARVLANLFVGGGKLDGRPAGGDLDPLGWAIRHLVREIDLSKFPNPKGTGRNRIDFRSGPNLIGKLADAVALYRRDLAKLLGVSEDEVLPVVLLDPGQRFAGDDESSKAALDALLGAVVARICRRRSGLGAVAIMTSDTTKAAARDLDLERFLSESGQRLAADIFAGSQAIMHNADVIAVCGEDNGVPFQRTQWVRVLQGRTGAPALVYPFRWETHLGRFRPRKSEPLRTMDHDRQGGGRGRSGGEGGRGGGRSWSLAPSGGIGDRQ